MVVLTPALKALQAASKAATEQEHAEARQLALGASASSSDPAEVLSMVAWLREAEPWPAMEWIDATGWAGETWRAVSCLVASGAPRPGG